MNQSPAKDALVCRTCGFALTDQEREDYVDQCGPCVSSPETEHRQKHRPHDGASECTCGDWVGPMTTLSNDDPRSFKAHLTAVEGGTS